MPHTVWVTTCIHLRVARPLQKKPATAMTTAIRAAMANRSQDKSWRRTRLYKLASTGDSANNCRTSDCVLIHWMGFLL